MIGAVGLSATAGCAPDLGDNESYVGCQTDEDCARLDDGGTARVCRNGFCVYPAGDGLGCEVDGELVGEGERIPCYTGPAETEGEGACRAGERECARGQLTSCLGEVVPREETCNGADDDCDGTVDELGQTECDTTMEGACAQGELVCRGTRAACEPLVDPEPEICDGLDNDCDGAVDEDLKPECYPEDTDGCVEEEDGTFTCTGQCKAGTGDCVDGEVANCDPDTFVTPQPETCDGRDNDCDGEVDEECECEDGETQSCYPGSEEDTVFEGTPCQRGEQTCDNGTWGPCEEAVLPAPETCANMGSDDDCDGVEDNIDLLGEPCSDDSQEGVCRRGTYDCSGSGDDAVLLCVTDEPSTEICDGRDNDCDGEVDEDFDLLNDEENCGECGNSCGTGLTCCSGECMNLDTSEDACGECGEACGSGRTCCGGECVNLETDTDHCGECGEGCGDGETCCSGSCTDIRNDPSNCGDCGEECSGEQMCCGGTCALEDEPACNGCPMTCPSGTECCNGSCVDTATDESNCGACGETCGDDEMCCDETCVAKDSMSNCRSCGNACDPDQLCCSGGCVDENEANCGSCGEECGANERCCGGTCTDITTDENCGGCGEGCGSGESCSNGECCPTGTTYCSSSDSAGSDGGCVDLSSDDAHCGSCGRTCRMGETCEDGCCCRGPNQCRC
ncbi:MAG: MopE-related protein [Myxococcota bacterium]